MTIDSVSEEHTAGNCCFKLKIMQLKEKIGFIVPSVYSMQKIKPMKKKTCLISMAGNKSVPGLS